MDASIISSIILGLSALGVSWFYSHRTNKLEGDKMMKELFTEFNQRYDKLNDSLVWIEKEGLSLKDLNKEKYKLQRQATIDFFNLCAEEFYWNQKGRVDPKVWKAWSSGMNYWVNEVSAIRELWESEIASNGKLSYYITGKEEFFKLKEK